MADETLQQPIDQAYEQDDQIANIEPVPAPGEKTSNETLPPVSSETTAASKDISDLDPDRHERDVNEDDNTKLRPVYTDTTAGLIEPTEDRWYLPFEDRSLEASK